MSKPNEPPKQTFALIPKIINGGIAGIVGVSIVFPLDLVKTRLQNQPEGQKQYKNMFDCFKKTYAAEGYFGMYRGSAVNIILVTPEKAIKLAANDLFRFYLTTPQGHLPISRQCIAGGLAGACQIVITTPMELLKIQMQDAGRTGGKERITAMGLTRKLLRERGIFGLYKGVTATAGRDILFSMIYFPLFATINAKGPRQAPGGPTPLWWNLVSGLTAGATGSFMVTPLDVIKTRMQTLTKGKGEIQYTSMWDCFTKTLKNEGVTALFKGGACRMIVLAPLFGIAQTVYYIGIAEYLLGYK